MQIFEKNRDLSGAKECSFCRSRNMLQNAPTLAIVAVHTEENGPPKVWKQTFHYFNDLLGAISTAIVAILLRILRG